MSFIRPAAFAAALVAVCSVASAETPQRYSVDLSVVRDGVEVVQSRTLVAERGRLQASLSDGAQTYDFNASLNPAPGEPLLGRLRLEGRLTVDGQKLAAPILTFPRHAGETAMSMREGDAQIFLKVTPVLEGLGRDVGRQ